MTAKRVEKDGVGGGQPPLLAWAGSGATSDTAGTAPRPKPDLPAEIAAPRSRKVRRVETAESMAKRQRQISVSEFFTKNRHLLGFDNPRKSLLTAIKEAVDNALDACEEANILPDVEVSIFDRGNERYRITIKDNGPGIVRNQIPNIFGKLLYGSKFHRLKMSRGQQGIGISAAGMYGLITTGRPMQIISRTSDRRPAHYFELRIDTKKNKPEIMTEFEVVWDSPNGTEVSIELKGKYQRGRQSVDEYLRATAIANPHVRIDYRMPDGSRILYDRSTNQLPPETDEIKPHPYGVELGVLQTMLKDSPARNLEGFLQAEFSRVSKRVALEICERAELSPRGYTSRISRAQVEMLLGGIENTKIMNPPTNCVAPIGEEQLVAGLASVVPADFYASSTRPPTVYRGNPFIIEAALAYGGDQPGDQPARVLRYANRVPLLYQQGACVSYNSVMKVNWRSYNVQQPRGGVPSAPLTVVVHMASVWVPFTSESKEAIAGYPEIEEQVVRALQECGRKLRIFLSKKRKAAEEDRKREYIQTYIPHIGIGLRDLLGLSDQEETNIVETLVDLLERTRDV